MLDKPKRIPLALCLVAVLGTAFRLQFGVDFSDESYYVAQAWRFVLGDRPFQDDHLLLSTMAFVTQPLLTAYQAVFPTLDGVILYFRMWYLLLALVTAVCVYRTLCVWVRPAIALFTASVCVIYIHHQMPAISYNTLALFLWTISVFSALPSVVSAKLRLNQAIAACASATLMAIVYPPLALAGMVLAIILFVRTRPSLRQAVLLMLPVVILTVGFSFWIDHQWDRILFVIGATSQAGGAQGLNKLIACLVAPWRWTPLKPVIGLMIAGAFVAHKLPQRWPPVLFLAIAILPMFLSLWVGRLSNGFPMHALGYVYFWALLGPVFYALTPKIPRGVFWSVFSLSVLAGVITAWSSSYGLVTMGFVIGLFPATLIALCTFAVWTDSFAHMSPWRITLPVYAVLACIAYYQRLPFKDDPLRQLNTRIVQGPFMGLMTSAQRALDEELMRTDIRRFAPKSSQIFVLESFPALYLYSRLRPVATILYKSCMQGRESCRDRYHSRYLPTNLVVHVKPYRYNLDVLSSVENYLQPRDPVIEFISQNHTLQLERDHYRIYQGSGQARASGLGNSDGQGHHGTTADYLAETIAAARLRKTGSPTRDKFRWP